jgi:hypothetical protein
VRDLELDAYEKLFANRAIYTGIQDEDAVNAKPLYRRVLGDAYGKLPAEIRAMHNVQNTAAGGGARPRTARK